MHRRRPIRGREGERAIGREADVAARPPIIWRGASASSNQRGRGRGSTRGVGARGSSNQSARCAGVVQSEGLVHMRGGEGKEVSAQ